MGQTKINHAIQETDYLIIGAGAMGMAFADEIFALRPDLKITIVDRRKKAGGHWNDAYPFVKLHQPAAFYGVNSLDLGKGTTDLSSKSELLEYYEKVTKKMVESNRVEFLMGHNYVGDGKVVEVQNPELITTYQVSKKVVDASYMNVEVPATHPPQYAVDEDVSIVPINQLANEYDRWKDFYVVGNGKTGMDAILFLLEKGVEATSIHWICPNQAWLFNRDHIQVGTVAKEVLNHASHLSSASEATDIFLNMEKTGGIMRIDEGSLPKKWRCATVNPQELKKLRSVKNILSKGRVKRIAKSSVVFEKGIHAYSGKALFVDCSANGLAKRKRVPIFSNGKITLQSILFCQQVFSAATIARLELTGLDEKKLNELIPVPHPELTEDWPSALAVSVQNLLFTHRHFPLWMFRSRLNFMSHESIINYFYYSVKAMFLSSSLKKAALRLSGQN